MTVLKPKQTRAIKPFVQTHPAMVAASQGKKRPTKANYATSKETREVIVRVMDRVKRI